MIQNNLDPEVAEKPDELIVYGGTGRAARSWEAFDRILTTLRRLKNDETLLVQSGKPVGVFRTHEWAPRVLIANALLVPKWATWEKFRELEAAGLTMYGQMTAGSWIYIGTQGILQGTYETFAAVARKHFGGTLAGRLVVTAGLGGMGGAQPLAITMNEGVGLIVEVEPANAERRRRQGFLDEIAPTLDDALQIAQRSLRDRTPRSIGLIANAADVLPELARRGVRVDVVTDQTSAHDPLDGYVPAGVEDVAGLRARDPEGYVRRSRASMARHCEAIVSLAKRGAVAFDYGNNLRGEAKEAGFADAFTRALRIGQSAIASLPSFIPSVSRKGEATEPESRWSRPMTIGALISPRSTSSSMRSPKSARSPYPSQHTRAGSPWNGTRSCASRIQRASVSFSGKSSRTSRSVRWMSAVSPESATQRNGPRPSANSGRMYSGTKLG